MCAIVIIAMPQATLYGETNYHMMSCESCSLDVNKLGKHEPQKWWRVDNGEMLALLLQTSSRVIK